MDGSDGMLVFQQVHYRSETEDHIITEEWMAPMAYYFFTSVARAELLSEFEVTKLLLFTNEELCAVSGSSQAPAPLSGWSRGAQGSECSTDITPSC